MNAEKEEEENRYHFISGASLPEMLCLHQFTLSIDAGREKREEKRRLSVGLSQNIIEQHLIK